MFWKYSNYFPLQRSKNNPKIVAYPIDKDPNLRYIYTCLNLYIILIFNEKQAFEKECFSYEDQYETAFAPTAAQKDNARRAVST